MKYITTINSKRFEIEITNDGRVLVDGHRREVDFLQLDESLYSVLTQTLSHEVVISEADEGYDLMMNGRLYTAEILDERAQLMRTRRGGQEAGSGEIVIKSPMPGLIVALPAAEGQAVTKGQTVIVLESMKMQNELKAPRDGTIARVHVAAGQSVEQNKPLITLT